jgi:hypothetical protein
MIFFSSEPCKQTWPIILISTDIHNDKHTKKGKEINIFKSLARSNVFSTKSEEQEVNLVWSNLCIFWLLFICLYHSWSLPNFVWKILCGKYISYIFHVFSEARYHILISNILFFNKLRQIIIPEIRSERQDLLIFIFILKTTGTFKYIFRIIFYVSLIKNDKQTKKGKEINIFKSLARSNVFSTKSKEQEVNLTILSIDVHKRCFNFN